MTSQSKNKLTTAVLLLAVIQGPFLYYFTEGFIKLILAVLFAIIGLILTIILLINLIKYRSSNSLYHNIGSIMAISIGIVTTSPYTMEYMDFKLLLSQRNKVVEEVKVGKLNAENSRNKDFGEITLKTRFPLSKDENKITIQRNRNAIVSVQFYIDRGFIDHYSVFLYTNNPDDIKSLDKGIAPGAFSGVAEKLDENWYRVGY